MSCCWKKQKAGARTGNGCVRVSRLAMKDARFRRAYTAGRVGGGSVTPTLRMSSGIRACCRMMTKVTTVNASEIESLFSSTP